MPQYQGRYRLTRDGAPAGEGTCRFEFDEKSFTLLPQNDKALSVDLGDIDWLGIADYQISAGLCTGETLTLSHLGKIYTECCETLRSAWSERLVWALLLSELPLVDTFRGSVGQAPCEVRVYEGTLAVLPDRAAPFHVRLSDIDSVAFQADSWEIAVTARRGVITFGKLAKRSDLFRNTLEEALANLRARSAAALRELFPMLTAASSQKLSAAWRAECLASCACLDSIDRRIWPALLERAVSEEQRPYAGHLASLSRPDLVHASFKRVMEATEAPAGEAGEPFAFCFFYPVPPNLVAQEVTSDAGHATYWFQGSTTPAALEELNTALALLNYRRQPIYLSEAAIQSHPQYSRYAVALRRVPELRAVRQRFRGRAIHSSLESWKKQVSEIVGA